MERRTVGSVIIALGALLVLAGLVVLLGVAPRFRSLGGDARWTQRLEGRLTTAIDLRTLASTGGRRLSVQRTIRAEAADGGATLVREETVMRTPQSRFLRTVEHYAVDSLTMEGTPERPRSWERSAGFRTVRGLVCGWPFDVHQGDYWGWVDAYLRAVPIRFVGEVVHAESDQVSYRFASSSDQEPVAQDEVAFLGLPDTVSKTLWLQLGESPQMNPVLRRLLPDVLAAWPGPSLPVDYTWEFHTQYWVEPQTGVVLDMHTRQILRVGLADEVAVATPLATLPASQRNALTVTVQEMRYSSTDDSTAEAVRMVDARLWPLNLYGTILPIALIVGGLLVGTVGSLLLSWRRYGA
jgi:hypothetical protein